jgi:DinB superfamily
VELPLPQALKATAMEQMINIRLIVSFIPICPIYNSVKIALPHQLWPCGENVWRNFDAFGCQIDRGDELTNCAAMTTFGYPKIEIAMRQFDYILQGLESNGLIIQQLLQDAPAEMIVFRPAPGKWNLLEIACHLVDEDAYDFGARVKHVLENPGVTPPSIDPQAWVLEKDYAGQDYATVIQQFVAGRREWISYLRALRNPNWENAWAHPKRGALPAKLFLENWLAHDYLHLRQIIATKYAYLLSVADVPMDYAGEW